MRNWFIGKSRTWLEERLAEAQEEIAGGSTLQAAGAGDANSAFVVQGNPEERIARLLYALHKIDPVTYPFADANPVRQTQGVFRDE